MLSIAIQNDDYTSKTTPDKVDASSPKWASILQEKGYQIKWVDVRNPLILSNLKGCVGFMWRWAQFEGMGAIARRLLPIIENTLGLVVYPNQQTCWHYDDKIAQAYLFEANNIPAPKTWVWFDRDEALEWIKGATYPMVIKLATGAGSKNVRLVENYAEAQNWVNRLFEYRLVTLSERHYLPLSYLKRIRLAASIIKHGHPIMVPYNGLEAQGGYVLFQDFLPGNDFDTRITVIGNRAFGFRRFNRDNDFRASGGGKLDYDVTKIDHRFIRLAFQTAQKIGAQSCAIDGLSDKGQPVVGEISYTYVSWCVYECPGHWELEGDPVNGKLTWVDGHMWPEEAQIEDFINCIENRRKNIP